MGPFCKITIFRTIYIEINIPFKLPFWLRNIPPPVYTSFDALYMCHFSMAVLPLFDRIHCLVNTCFCSIYGMQNDGVHDVHVAIYLYIKVHLHIIYY